MKSRAQASQRIEFTPQLVNKRGRGMMAAEVYQQLYNTALACGGGHIVEVGTGFGASALALAFGLRDSGYGASSQVHTIDRMSYYGYTPSPRLTEFLSHGFAIRTQIDKSDKIPEIKRVFKELGFGELINFYTESSTAAKRHLPNDMRISGLFIDSDGCIDRDLALFYNQLKPGGFIVIDDCMDEIVLSVQRRRLLWGISLEQKHKLTFELVKIFTKEGLLTDINFYNRTCFAKKPLHVTSDIDFKAIDVLPAYRELTRPYVVWRWSIKKILRRCLPWL